MRNPKMLLLVGAVTGVCALASGQSSSYGQASDTSSTTTTTRTTFRGPIVRFEPGKVIVLHEGDRDVSYTLTQDVDVPSDIAVGNVVTVTTRPGTTTVSRITTQDTDAAGRPRQTTETRRMDDQGNVVTTRETTVFGTVSAYEPGKSVTIEDHGKKVTYIVTDASQAPSSIRIGKKVRIYTVPATSGQQPIAKRITVTTETTSPPDQQ